MALATVRGIAGVGEAPRQEIAEIEAGTGGTRYGDLMFSSAFAIG